MNLDIVLLSLILAIAVSIASACLGRSFAWIGKVLILFFSVTGSVAICTAWSHFRPAASIPEKNIENRPVACRKDGYVGSDTCRACHPHHFETWFASHHRTMTQVPTRSSVVADFDNKTIRHDGQEFRFYRKDNEFFLEIKNLQSEASKKRLDNNTFKIVLSTGAHHQQSFWCETGQGRSLRKIPFIWINAEQRWIPYGSIFMIPSSGLSMHAGIWNRNCIKCHTVGGQPRHTGESDYDTHVAEFGISCEACHGPAENHAAIHRNPLQRYQQHFSDEDDTTLVSPTDLSHVKSSQVCAQCHSVFDFFNDQDKSEFNQNGFVYRPGDDLRDSRHIFQMDRDKGKAVVQRTLKRNPKFFEWQFWSDGMVRVSGREYNGLLETACYEHGTMSCLSCHEMHPDSSDSRTLEQWADDQLKPGMRGNESCLQCHEDFRAEQSLVEHTHHAATSTGSSCYNCHMPHTTLGLMKAMRSHTVDVPDVAVTVSTGRPNACNLCHLDKTLAWTSAKLSEWYEIPEPKLSRDEREIASSVRWVLKGDAGQRAIAGWHFGWQPAKETSGTEWMAPYLAELLSDDYDVVRFIGFHSLTGLPGFADFDYDFVGQVESRERRKRMADAIWENQETRPAPNEALLINSNRTISRDSFERLRKERSKKRVILIE